MCERSSKSKTDTEQLALKSTDRLLLEKLAEMEEMQEQLHAKIEERKRLLIEAKSNLH